MVGASLDVMAADSKRMRGDRPFMFTNLMNMDGVDKVIEWIKRDVLFEGL
jgi:urease accessory protein